MSWKFDNERPIYSQLLEILQMQIVSGQYGPGDKLPSVRELAANANVNPNTMQKAFAALEQSGLICTQRTSGRTVTEDIGVIKTVQKDLASSHITQFIQKMKELGFTKEEIKSLLESSIEEGKYE
jgi:DNA-binding transcriptional regulator YhcF (GntR family)